MERPDGIPDAAEYAEDEGAWELGPRRGNQRHGAFTFWRPDGSKQAEVRFKDNVRHGPFRRYHESGELAREGAYRHGEFHGVVVITASKSTSTEPPFDGASADVLRTEVEYAHGRMVAVRHFGADRQRVSVDGTPLPDLPRGVPSLAAFDVGQRRWVHGPIDADGRRSGLTMYWSEDGTLLEESEYRDDRRDGVCRRYSHDAILIEEGTFADDQMSGTWSFYEPEDGRLVRKADYDDGKFHGSVVDFGKDGRSRTRIEYDEGKKTGQYLARADKSKYAGGTIRVENGQYKDDMPVGRWKLLDKALKPVRTIDFGLVKSDEELDDSEVFVDEAREDFAWAALADSYKDARSIGESLIATARAASASGSASALEERLDTETAPLSDAWLDSTADDVINASGQRLSGLTHALVGGASTARILEALALRMVKRKRPRAALDLLNAAILLDRRRPSLFKNHGLVQIHLGEPDRARVDVRALGELHDDGAGFLGSYIDALFPTYGFWPSSFDVTKQKAAKKAVALVRDASAIADLIQVYATRYEVLRARVLARTDGIPSWSPPDATPLLPNGPRPLRSIVDDDGRIDESIADDIQDIPTLMVWLRASYACMCWLSWTAGRDRPCLPHTMLTPREFSLVASLIADRARVLSDVTETPEGFSWNGKPVEDAAALAREVARIEFEEAALVMQWLADPGMASPFVVDKRPAPPVLGT